MHSGELLALRFDAYVVPGGTLYQHSTDALGNVVAA